MVEVTEPQAQESAVVQVVVESMQTEIHQTAVVQVTHQALLHLKEMMVVVPQPTVVQIKQLVAVAVERVLLVAMEA
jgi:uncharacterized membrane-anchored protein